MIDSRLASSSEISSTADLRHCEQVQSKTSSEHGHLRDREDDAEAYKAGVEHFGNQPFLIKQVLADDTTVSFPALTMGMINATV